MITPMRVEKWRGPSIGPRGTPTLRGWGVEASNKSERREPGECSVLEVK